MVHAAAVCAHTLGAGATAACTAGPQASAEAPPEPAPEQPAAVILGESHPLVATALDALAARPEARIEDAYKFLFQATRGGEHAAPDEASARTYLAREWASLPAPDPSSDEPAIEWLRHDGALVRLHLRPAKALGVSQDAVLAAFLASARAVRMDASGLTYAWQALGERLRQRPQGHLTRAAWDALDAAMRPKDYPAVHHSEPYSTAYAPAYRVMRRSDAEAVLKVRR
jgi:hypothetical protein